MNNHLRISEVVPSEVKESAKFCFLPAHGGSRAGAVAEFVGRTLTEGSGDAVLLADFRSPHSVETLRHSEAIFVVSDSDQISLDETRRIARWLRSARVGVECGLMLRRVPGGIDAVQAEAITGLPLCCLAENDEQLGQFARWLASEISPSRELQVA